MLLLMLCLNRGERFCWAHFRPRSNFALLAFFGFLAPSVVGSSGHKSHTHTHTLWPTQLIVPLSGGVQREESAKQNCPNQFICNAYTTLKNNWNGMASCNLAAALIFLTICIPHFQILHLSIYNIHIIPVMVMAAIAVDPDRVRNANRYSI